MSKIFICYSHKDEKYLKLLLKHLDNDLLDIWSDKKIEGGEHWNEKIQEALNSVNCGLLILSANFFNSKFIKDIELHQLLQNQYDKNTFLVPILAEYCNIDKYSWIKKKEVLPKGFISIENIKKRDRNKEISKIVKKIELLLSPVPESLNTKDEVISYNYPDAIAVNNFPSSDDKFFGRERYLEILDKAWDDEQVNIISFIAFGGIGKTSLIDNWLKKMKESHYKGAKNIFMWSFYSQGCQEDRQVTATEFLIEACKFFKIKNLPKTAYEQGKELSNIISKQRALIVLDGLEPLQYSLNDIGEIKDDGLQVLLKRLSRQNKGLVIITSRIKLTSIDNEYKELEKLEDYEGAKFLKSFELNGTDKELEKISRDFDGHALALKLLGSYTKVVLNKDINRIIEIESLRDDKTKSSKHATRMLNSYKKYLEKEGKFELDILKLLGFFDRAVSYEVVDILKNRPLIESINDRLVDIADINWKYALHNLKELHLISNNTEVIDTHPLVREYFSKYIEDSCYDSYIKGHDSLYKYYESLPEEKFPDTVEKMEPLFRAIYHGCKSKNFDEVFLNIYLLRINKNDSMFLMNYLTRFDISLQLLSNFFIKPFDSFYNNINEGIKDQIVSHLAYSISTLGRHTKAIPLYEKALEMCLNNKKSDSIIRNVSNIIDSKIFSGDFVDIDDYYEKYNSYSSNCKDTQLLAILKGSYGYSFFLKGDFERANILMLECESIILNDAQNTKKIFMFLPDDEYENKVKLIPKYITSVMSYMYFEYLFYIEDYFSIEKRINSILEFHIAVKWTLDIGLSYIVLGKLKLNKNRKIKFVIDTYDMGMKYLRKARDTNYIIIGIIAQAKMYLKYQYFNKVNENLEEAYDLIIHSETKLLLADWYIVAIKLAIDEKNFIKSNTYFIEAKALSQELNEYFIFKEELKKLEANCHGEV